MFQFPEFALPPLCIQEGMTPKGRVSPFRYLRIIAFCQLPVAFRRLTRLSSPVIAKASTTCTYSLDPITLSPHQNSLQLIVDSFLLTANCSFWQSVIYVSHLNLRFIRLKGSDFAKVCVQPVMTNHRLSWYNQKPIRVQPAFSYPTQKWICMRHALRKPTTYYLLLPNF